MIESSDGGCIFVFLSAAAVTGTLLAYIAKGVCVYLLMGNLFV